MAALRQERLVVLCNGFERDFHGGTQVEAVASTYLYTQYEASRDHARSKVAQRCGQAKKRTGLVRADLRANIPQLDVTDCRTATWTDCNNRSSVAAHKRGLLSFQGLISPIYGPDRAFAQVSLTDVECGIRSQADGGWPC